MLHAELRDHRNRKGPAGLRCRPSLRVPERRPGEA